MRRGRRSSARLDHGGDEQCARVARSIRRPGSRCRPGLTRSKRPCRSIQKVKFTKFDETVEIVGAARRRSEALRPDGARHGRAAARAGQVEARARHRRRRQAARGEGGRRRRGRRRRGRREDPGRLDGLRRGRGDARHDARRRQARQGARAARPDAEPEDRHRDARRHEGRPGNQGRQGRVPRRQGRRRARADRQDLVRGRAARSPTRTR